MQSRGTNGPKGSQREPESKKARNPRWRHPFLYIFSFIILIIIVVTFVGGPVLSGVGGRSQVVFGSWGGREIRFVQGNYLARQRDILYEQLREQDNERSYEWQAYRVWKGAYDRTVMHTAILEICERSGLHVSEDRVDQMLLTQGPYMVDGEFSEERYRETSNADKQQYRKLVREDLIHQQYVTDLNHGELFSTGAREFLQDMASPQRAFEFAQTTYSDYPDTEVVSYGEEHASLFRRIKLSRITVKAGRDQAETVRQQIVDGVQTFEDQAENQSTDAFADKGGEMGWREYHALQADLASTADLDALFSLPQGELSPVYETDFGFVFYRVDEPAVAPDFEDPETVASVRDYMTRFERGIIEDYLIARMEGLRDAYAASPDFTAVAEREGLSVFETNYFPLNYGATFLFERPTVTNSEEQDVSLESAAYSERFFETVFQLESDELSEPLVLDDAVAVFRLMDERTPAEDDVSYISEYYPYVYRQYLDQDLNEYIFSSEEFEDNFAPVFSEIFLSE